MRPLHTSAEIGSEADRTLQRLVRHCRKAEQGACRTIISDAATQRCGEHARDPASAARWQGIERGDHAADDRAALAQDGARIAAIWQQLAHEIHIDGGGDGGQAGAGEAFDADPRIRRGEAAIGRLIEIEAAIRLAAEAEARRDGIGNGQIDIVQAALQRETVAILTGQLQRPAGQQNSRGLQPILAFARNDPRGVLRLEIDAVGPAIQRDPPQIGLEIGIGSDPEWYAVEPLRINLRGPVAALIIHLGAGGVDIELAIIGVGELHIGHHGRLII